jgi:hypothetical protein
VILVAVGDDDRLDGVSAFPEIAEVRQYQVDAVHLAVGNRTPQSITTIRPSYSITDMFLPISPSPPSGRTRSVPR